MKLPLSWVKEYAPVALSGRAYQEKMTMGGTAVEGIEDLSASMSGVVVGRVISCVKHDNSDHLSVCLVDVGADEALQVVCGAPNVKEGLLVPVAQVGANLPDGMTIKRGKIRGVESFGMLCSATELKVPQDLYPSVGEAGLLIFNENYQPGTDVRDIFGFDDLIVDYDILANRPDCLSVWGIARETAAICEVPCDIPVPTVMGGAGPVKDIASVRVDSPKLCPRYTLRAVKNVRIAPSPMWVRQKLHKAGIRAINNIVDITNLVMLETGHPMHAFDRAHVAGSAIIVREAKNGEELVTLDGKKHALTGGELLICDRDKPVGLAGIMGGENSEITDATTEILFECAAFDRTATRLTARRLGIRTESSGRFERGVSPATVMTAMDRACQLVEELGAGLVSDDAIDLYPAPLTAAELDCSVSAINRRIGMSLSKDDMMALLARLGFETEAQGVRLLVKAPLYRQDIEQEADISEEILRLAGYEHIPSTPLSGTFTGGGESAGRALKRRLSDLLVGFGYDETMSYSFMSDKDLRLLQLPDDHPWLSPVKLSNPLGEDTAVMRPTPLPQMLKTLSLNQNRGIKHARLWEFAVSFSDRADDSQPHGEKPVLCLGAYGATEDFYALRDDVLCLLTKEGIEAQVLPTDAPWLHPGRRAKLTVGDNVLATLGEVHPAVRDNFDLPERCLVAELDMDAINRLRQDMGALTPLPKTPAVARDLALVVDRAQPLGPIADAIRQAAGQTLEDLSLFDVYQGQQIAQDKKSAAFKLTLRGREQTLTEAQITQVIDRVLRRLKNDFGAEIRQ